jgi:Ca-activated chloride channel family protein
VILCTDGDFNVGVSGDDELVTLITDKAKNSGVFLSIFGFGMGNYKDAKLEKLADKGNGHYAYIDNEREAKKVFVEELTGTLYTIAKDVKIQVEFNPAHVGAYRLIGYENRILAAQDFNDDTKDAGEIGAGHTVTALYEVIPQGVMPAVAQDVDRLKYQPLPEADPKTEPSPEMLTLKLRWKKPEEDVSVKREYPVMDPGKKAAEPASDTEWQAAVAAFGMVLRNSKHKGQADLRLVKELALGSRGPDPTGLRREFIDLILTTERLASGQPLQPAEVPQAQPAEEAEKTASVKGKYQTLLKTLAAPEDLGVYGAFNDYGYWEGKTYGDNEDLPKAHWVYVYPNWYLWESAQGK